MLRIGRLLGAVTLYLFANASYAQSAADRQSAREIRQRFDAFNAAWERRDAGFVNRFFAHDSSGVFFFERRQLAGWPKVDTLYSNMFASAARGRVRSLANVLDVGARGSVGWLAANFRLEVIETNGDTTADEGRVSLVFEKRQGEWVVVHRHTSFQAPAGAQKHVPLFNGPGPLWSPADDTTGGPAARAIRARRESSNLAIAKHDTAGFAAIFAPDIVVTTSASRKTVGRAGAIVGLSDQFKTRPDVVYRRTPETITVFDAWRMASESGHWAGSWTDTDGKISIGGSYFAKWGMINGAWFVESETYVPERCTGGKVCTTVP